MDGLALALYLSLPRARRSSAISDLNGFLFCCDFTFCSSKAEVPMAALFYAGQLPPNVSGLCGSHHGMCGRSACWTRADERHGGWAYLPKRPRSLLERFGLGILQAGGTEGHQNPLGMMSHFVVFPFFALFVCWAGERGRTVACRGNNRRRHRPGADHIARHRRGCRVCIFNPIPLLSAVRQWTSQKGRILLIGIAAAASLAPFFISSLEKPTPHRERYCRRLRRACRLRKDGSADPLGKPVRGRSQPICRNCNY